MVIDLQIKRDQNYEERPSKQNSKFQKNNETLSESGLKEQQE